MVYLVCCGWTLQACWGCAAGTAVCYGAVLSCQTLLSAWDVCAASGKQQGGLTGSTVYWEALLIGQHCGWRQRYLVTLFHLRHAMKRAAYRKSDW
jgi:hypothetical protein